MIAMMLSEVAQVLGAKLRGDDVAIRGLTTDSRNAQAAQMFVALHGPNFDGHRFVGAARANGCSGVLCERSVDDGPAVLVDDALHALGQLGMHWRDRFLVDTVAVTGSNGKTTVKEMLACILGADAPVLATSGNLNNNIGVPLTLSRLDTGHQRLVVELGANHRGEIAMLCTLARPRVGVITLVAPAHLEGFGDIEGVARAKGEIISGLPPDGVAVVNADGQWMSLWRELAGQREMVTFGFAADADVRVHYRAASSGAALQLVCDAGEIDVRLQLDGRHNACNAAAATAAALAMGVDLDTVKRGLEAVQPVAGRLQRHRGSRGESILDDTYNANPHSLRAALEVLGEAPSPRLLVLGDMAELGADAQSMHEEAGVMAREAGVDALYAVGPLSRMTSRAFGAGGRHFDSHEALCAALEESMPGHATVLVKGSRSMAMEQVVRALTEERTTCC